VRLFVALALPGRLRAGLATLYVQQRRDLPRARWVAEDKMHLTLTFIGTVPPPDLGPIERALQSETESHAPLRLELSLPGTFPPSGRTRVAWVGLRQSTAMACLQSDLASALAEATGRPADRHYHAHVTMARCKPKWPRWAGDRWRTGSLACSDPTFEVTYVDLMQSELTSSGPTYTTVRRFPLRG